MNKIHIDLTREASIILASLSETHGYTDDEINTIVSGLIIRYLSGRGRIMLDKELQACQLAGKNSIIKELREMIR